MSYVFPKHRLEADTPMDHEEVNENFQDLIGEASGGLNEHNFSSNTFNDGMALGGNTSTPVMCWFGANEKVDPAYQCINGQVERGGRATGVGYDALNPGLFSQRVQGVWDTIAGLTRTFSATGGTYWILGSLQHDGRSKMLTTQQVPDYFWNHYGALYAIRVNNQIIYETITGGVHNNPVISRGTIRMGGSGHKLVSFSNSGEKVYDTHSVHGDTGLFPVSLDFVVQLPPGTHTIDIIMQTLPHSQPGNVSVSNRELIILEMRA
mgnify:CR=1 FL=1